VIVTAETVVASATFYCVAFGLIPRGSKNDYTRGTSKLIHKSRNVNILMYHTVCHAKYGRVVITDGADKKLKEICPETEKRYEIKIFRNGGRERPCAFSGTVSTGV
jgi:hypothetical protein